MEIEFFQPKDFEGNLKATIHVSGKLGFTDAAIKKIGISEKKGIKIGRNSKQAADKNLYAVFVDSSDETAFKINKAGAYYYVNTKALFDTMEIPYRTKRVSFDIVASELNGAKMYKLIYKEKIKTNDKHDEFDDN